MPGGTSIRISRRIRDEGRVSDARRILQDNQRFLRDNARQYRSKKLKKLESRNKESADNLDERNWNRTRKQMRKFDFEESMQQSY